MGSSPGLLKEVFYFQIFAVFFLDFFSKLISFPSLKEESHNTCRNGVSLRDLLVLLTGSDNNLEILTLIFRSA